MATIDFLQKYKEGLSRIRTCLVETNIKGCLNNSIDLTRASNFVGFNEGVFIGEVLEGIFNNFNEIVSLYEYKKEEIEPIKSELKKMIDVMEARFPSKDSKTKAELFEILVSARYCVTQSQIEFARTKKIKVTGPTRFEPVFE